MNLMYLKNETGLSGAGKSLSEDLPMVHGSDILDVSALATSGFIAT